MVSASLTPFGYSDHLDMRIKWQVAQMESSSPTPLFVSLTHAHGLPHLGRFSHSTHTAPLGGDERKGSLASHPAALPPGSSWAEQAPGPALCAWCSGHGAQAGGRDLQHCPQEKGAERRAASKPGASGSSPRPGLS